MSVKIIFKNDAMKYITTLLLIIYALSEWPEACKADTTKNDSIMTDSIERELSLNEFFVKAERIRKKNGGYSISLAGSDMSKGKDMNGLLAQLPGITLEEGSIMVQGQAPAAVYVDGIKTDMDILKSLPAERIANVEINWNAGRNEMTGIRGGVIRIRTKKEFGMAGTLNGSIHYLPEYGYSGETVSLFTSVGTKRMTVYNNAMFYHKKRNGDYEETRTLKNNDTNTFTEEKMRGWPRFFQNWLNISYDISKEHKLGLSGLLVYDDEKEHTNATTYSNNLQEKILTTHTNPSYSINAQTVALYNWNIDSIGSGLTVTADYLKRNTSQHLVTKTENGQSLDTKKSSTKQETDMLRISPIWKKVMNNGNEMTSGIDFRHIWLRDISTNSISTTHSRMRSYTPAVFVSYSGKINKTLNYEAGVRVQYDNMSVKIADNTQARTQTVNDYTKWSINPSFSLDYDLNPDKGHSIYLNYEHYVDELPYDAISSFKRYDEADHYTVGNPGIKPMIGNTASLTFTMFNKFSIFVRYYYDKDAIYYTNDVDPDDNKVLRSMPRNAKYESGFTIGMEQRIKPTRWWTLKTTERFILYSGNTPDWKVSGQTHWIFSMDSEFKFGKSTGGNIYAYAEPAFHTQDQIWKTVIDVTCNVYKTFFKDRLIMALDIKPYRIGRKTITENRHYYSARRNTTEEEYLKFTVRLNFSKGKIKNRKTARSTQEYNKINRTKP